MLQTSHVYTEILQQPQVIERLLVRERGRIEKLATALAQRQITHVVIAARGTSDNAARYAQYLFGSINGLLVTLATPSLFSIYNRPPQFGNALVLGISQSGRSPDIVAVLDEARRQNTLTAAITNTPDSPLARVADHVIDLGAGAERAVAATKTYTAQLAALALVSATLADDAAMFTALDDLPDLLDETLDLNPTIGQQVERYRYAQRCVVIGRGYNYATAFELALKLKELTYTVVEPYSSADFLHGPLALIEDGFPVMVIAPSGVLLPELVAFTATVRERGAEIIAISNAPMMLDGVRTALHVPAVPEWLSPLLTIVPGQLWAAHLAHARGYNVDQPRGIHKVTETH